MTGAKNRLTACANQLGDGMVARSSGRGELMRGWIGLATLALATSATADVPAGSAAWARGDYREAVAQWRGPAVAGDAVAQFNLGQAYKLGRGVPVDPTLAEGWFRKAALQGLAQGEDNYGLALFQAGKRADALPWLEKSAGRGEPRCQLVLGTMLFNGDGSPRDYPRAYALITRAAAAGLPSASQTLAEMDGYITPADRERGTALADQYAHATPAAPTPGIVRVTDVPAARVPEDKPVVADLPRATPTPRATRPTVAVKPAPVRPAPVVTAKGGFRAQLGAFKDKANAEALWSRVKGKMTGAAPAYVAGGGVTRLQATGFPTRAAAEAACARAGVSGCIVTGG